MWRRTALTLLVIVLAYTQRTGRLGPFLSHVIGGVVWACLVPLRWVLMHEYTASIGIVAAIAVAFRVLEKYTALAERLASLLESDDGRDAIVANRRLRVLKTGMQIMEYARDPKSSGRAAVRAVKRMNKRRQILKKTEPGTGLRHLHSRPDGPAIPLAPSAEWSYFSDGEGSALSDGGGWAGGGGEGRGLGLEEALRGVEALRHLDTRSIELLAQASAPISPDLARSPEISQERPPIFCV